jgi:hypothetical protein
MTAIAAATMSPPQVICLRENHQAIVEIKIAGQDFGRPLAGILQTIKLRHAVTADAGLVPQLVRHLHEQLVGKFHFFAPARAFVGGISAKLATVWLAANGALPGVNSGCW